MNPPFPLNTKHTLGLLKASAEILGTDPRDVDALGFLGRMLVQATLPHSKPEGRKFERSNGGLTIRMTATEDGIGLPYGTYPRLLLAWVTTEAARTGSPKLNLGHSLAAFMAQLGLVATGGEKGTVTALRRQMDMLFRASIAWDYIGEGRSQKTQLFPFEGHQLWWDPIAPKQQDLFRSKLVLNQTFFNELVKRPVPLDMRALKFLANLRSPLALDIYTWLTYRMSTLKEPVNIPWASLEMQFGADYADTREFRRKFLEKLKIVKELYPTAKVAPAEDGLSLWPSPTHVPARAASKIIEIGVPPKGEE